MKEIMQEKIRIIKQLTRLEMSYLDKGVLIEDKDDTTLWKFK